MLPAKFRGFASRVGRLASRALAWHKTSERDGALSATSSTASATSNSDASAYRPSRTSHTLRRALFAMLVVVATLFATFVVPPVHKANATQAWWDYAGNGYFTDGNFWVGDAVRDISITYPNIEYNQWDSDNNKNGTKISWDIIFNQESIGFSSASLKQLPKGNQPKDGASWEGRPLFIVFLPKGLRDGDANHKSSVYITRTKTVRKLDNESHKFIFTNEVKHNHERPAEFATGRNYSYADGDKDFQTVWNATFGKYGNDATCGDFTKQYGFCEIHKWRGTPHNSNDPSNKFGRVLADWGQSDTTYGYKWHIEAFVEDGVNPETLPIIAGWNSNGTLGSWGSGTRNKWAAMGPYDTDGDGIPDYVEHQVKMNTTNGDEISYPQYNGSDDKKYGQDNIPITAYHRPITVKPFARTGEWEGDSSNGSFGYDGGTTTNLPTNLGIKYELTKNIPNGVRVVNSPSKMPEGSVYIDSRTGHVTYNPRKEDKGKVLEFGTKITYPDPSRYPYNCKYYDRGSFTTEQHPTKIKVVSQASLYNPVYTPIDLTEKTGENQRDVIPIVYTAKPRSVKDSSKKHADSIQEGDLPKDATFELKQYVKGNSKSDPVLDWSRIEDQDKNNGKVRFYSNKWREPVKKYRTPVVVHYADGSSSTDGDAGNADKNGDFAKSVVYASVNLKRPNPKDYELKLNIHNGYARSNLGDNGSVTVTVNDPLNPSIWIDSWAQYQIGQISLKSLCWKETKEGNSVKKDSYTFSDLSKTNNDNTINGLTFKQTEKWPHATDSEQETCFANGTCNNKKLFDKDAFTIERSRGEISGTPKKGGKYVCRVFALRDGSQAKTDFDKAVETKNYNVSLPSGSQRYDWQSKTVTFVAHSLAHKYNPQYVKVNVKVGHKGGVTSAAPVSQSGSNGVKGDDKSQNDLVPNGTRLPKGTWFELKKYKDSKTVLSWSKFEGKQSNKKSGKDEPDDTSSEEMYGKVTFVPPNGTLVGEYSTPVIVHYPDGSTSEDPDSGNLGKPVYAPVSVTDQDIQDDDLKLRVYSQYGGRQIGDNDRTGIRFRPGEVLGDNKGNTKPMFFDSWSSAKPGKIYQRMLCYKLGTDNKRSGYEIDGINGLTLAGREGNTLDGKFTSKPSQWTRANNEQRNDCKADGSKCNHNLYLYGDERDTTERTWGWLQGKVKNNGDYVCTVYAIKDLENKDGNHGNLQKKFDTELNKFVKNPGDRNFEDVISKSVLTNQKGSKNNPIDATQRHVDWDSVTFPIHVHNDAHYYNPQYTTLTMEAGTKQDTEVPKSEKNANGADKLQDDVRVGDLPDGTWFEFNPKSKLSYAFFEDDQDNKADSGDSAKNPTGKFGKVTFRPHRWFPATTSGKPEKTQVIVHYPDGSISEDKDSGNNGKPIYATVNITRSHDEDANNLHLNVGDKEGSGNWQNTAIDLSKDEELNTSAQTTRWLDSWSQYKPGKINLRTICHKVNPDNTNSHYQAGGIAGIKMQDVKIWDHTEDAERQKACEKDRSKCYPDTQLYDDYITNGNSRNTTERTRGWIKGTAKETGDYECVVYAIKDKQHLINDNDDLLTRFDKAVASITPKNGKVTPSDTDPLQGFQWNLSGSGSNAVKAKKGVDYEYRTIPIHIHTQAHKYNPVYDKVSVQAGKEVQSGLPKNKKPTGDQVETDSLAYEAIAADNTAFPDGTWFELKKDAPSTANYANAYDWSFWKKGLNGQNDSNAPNTAGTNPLNHSGKDAGIGSGSKYGKVTFHPDVTIDTKDYYQTHVVVHYPDGSTSDDPDAGNNQFKASSSATSTMNPVFAKVQVTVGYKGTDLRMVLTKAKDTDSPLNSNSDLTVMKGIGLLKNPFVQAWSVKDTGKINLRMMCTKQGEQKWSRGLESTLNMHLGNNYGESTPEWNFATEEQQKECRENGVCHVEHVLYGFLNDNAQPGSVESAVARREEEIEGAPKETGTYSCSVFALKDKALTAFAAAVQENVPKNDGSYTSTDMGKVNLSSKDSTLKQSSDWDRISFKVHVVEQFALPKTGGEGMSMALLVVAMIAMCVMCGAFFVDQTKWGHAMLVGAAGTAVSAAAGMMLGLRSATQNSNSNSNSNRNRKISEIWRGLVKKVKDIRRFDEYSASAKDFVRKVTGWLRAAFRRVRRWATERWRC